MPLLKSGAQIGMQQPHQHRVQVEHYTSTNATQESMCFLSSHIPLLGPCYLKQTFVEHLLCTKLETFYFNSDNKLVESSYWFSHFTLK